MVRPEMYLVCGQCGTLNAIKGPVEPSTSAARCSNCHHKIPLKLHLRGPEAGVDRDALFPQREVGFATLARKALRERIMVVCGSCKSKMKVGKRLAGKTVKCPSCSAEIRVPFLDEEDQFDISLLISAARQAPEEQDDEVVEMDESDYEEIREDVLIGRGVFKITRTRLVLFVSFYLVIMVSVLAGGIILKRITAKDDSPAQPVGSQVPVVPAASTPQTRQFVPPAATVDAAEWDAFASGGYRPARPGTLYGKITATVRAGSDPLELANAGQTVTLKSSAEQYRCLGEPLDAPVAPVLARRRIIRLQPGQQTTVIFLFELPAEALTGTLNIEGLASQVVSLPSPPTPAAGFDGTWIEQPPRNLKPLLRQPVMAQLQRTPEQRLQIRQRGNRLSLWMPDAQVSGTVSTNGTAGLATANLRYDDHRLDCTLRLTPDGDGLVLFLDEAPMHQITYRRQPPPMPTAQANRK